MLTKVRRTLEKRTNINAWIRNSIICLLHHAKCLLNITSRNPVSLFKTMVVDYGHLTRDNQICQIGLERIGLHKDRRNSGSNPFSFVLRPFNFVQLLHHHHPAINTCVPTFTTLPLPNKPRLEFRSGCELSIKAQYSLSIFCRRFC